MLKGVLSLYSPRYPRTLARALADRGYHPWPYLKWFWQTSNFRYAESTGQTLQERFIVALVSLGIVCEIIAGIICILQWSWGDFAGGWQFGLALIIAYPIVWAHFIFVPLLLWQLTHPKRVGRWLVLSILTSQVKRLRRRHTFDLVAVAGSVGKTSTKIAIASLLGATRRVQWQEGNYNDPVTVPLIFFGQSEPSLFNFFAWLRIFARNESMLRKPYPYQMVVVELGTDKPGDIAQFAYLKPELVVMTAITPEHMEFFGTLDAVAAEELTALNYTQKALVNADDIPAQYLVRKDFITYGTTPHCNYFVSERQSHKLEGQKAKFYLGKDKVFEETIALLGNQGAKVAIAAIAVAHILGLSADDIRTGVRDIKAFAGRMQVLPGIKDSVLIDDTYNATPIAVKAALDVLYSGKAPQRIAILGSMNELGDYSPEAHKEVGEYCDPAKLDLIVTIGKDANEHLAPVAKARDCRVETFLDPYEAGAFVKKELKEGAVVLAKGSQNRVFAEEALKPLLLHKEDEVKLVRQSPQWMTQKSKQFT